MKKIYLISSIAAVAGILFGFDTGVISGAILFIEKDFQLSTFQTECVICSVLLGAILGAFLSGRLCDSIGRKKILLTAGCIFSAGTILSGLAPNVQALITGRLILGIAIGISSFAAPLYLAELSPKKNRGFLVTLNQLGITFGILLSYIVDYLLASNEAWRLMLLFGLIPALTLVFGSMVLPESPRYLAFKGRLKEAKQILMYLRSSQEVDQELSEIQTAKTEQYHWQELIKKPRFLKLLSVGMLLAIIQQITGINTLIYYAPKVFQMAGFDTSSAIFVTSIVGLTNVIFTIIALPLVDRLGRRTLLYIGLGGMIISLMCLGLTFQQTQLNEFMRMLTLFSMMLYIACFAISLGPVVFVLLSEIFPLRMRGLGMSIAMGANWLSNMIVALTFLTLIGKLGPSKTFYGYALVSILSMFFIYFFIPETKGKSLEQLEESLNSGLKLKHLGSNL